MKIDAKVEFSEAAEKKFNRSSIEVPVDMDYVNADAESVISWIANELETMLGQAVMNDGFEVINMQDIIEDLSYDEYLEKIN